MVMQREECHCLIFVGTSVCGRGYVWTVGGAREGIILVEKAAVFQWRHGNTDGETLGNGEEHGFWRQTCWALPPMSCVTWGMLFSLPVPYFRHLQKRDNNSTCFIRLWWGLKWVNLRGVFKTIPAYSRYYEWCLFFIKIQINLWLMTNEWNILGIQRRVA